MPRMVSAARRTLSPRRAGSRPTADTTPSASATPSATSRVCAEHRCDGAPFMGNGTAMGYIDVQSLLEARRDDLTEATVREQVLIGPLPVDRQQWRLGRDGGPTDADSIPCFLRSDSTGPWPLGLGHADIQHGLCVTRAYGRPPLPQRHHHE